MVAALSAWPWENLGNLKYLLYAPLAAQVMYSRVHEEENPRATLCLHILTISSLRGLIHVLWSSFTNMLFLTRSRCINQQGVGFKQIDHEWHWDNFILLQAIIASMVCYMSPFLNSLPLWNPRGFIALLVVHVTISEPLHYIAHRCLHGYNSLFTHHHSFHHSSPVPHPLTAGNATFLEHLILCIEIGAPLLGSYLLGVGSTSLIYGYVLVFDFLRCLGHCNVEIISHKMFETVPFLRYLLYTPTYHSLHHKDMGTNFCLFMPLFDALGNTLNHDSWKLHRKFSSGAVENRRVPDFVFLAHAVDVLSGMHAPFVFRSFSSMPYTFRIFLLPMWPGAFLVMLAMWAWSKAFTLSFYNLRDKLCQSWAVPRFGFQVHFTHI